MRNEKDDLAFAEKRATFKAYKKPGGKTESYHPVILLVYFVGMAVVTMITLNPILLCISFIGALFCTGMLEGLVKLLKSLTFTIPMLLLIALVNPVFVHRGETILFFLNDNPVTLEAIIYGGSTSFMIITAFYWFKCYSIVMTSDKFVYLFGRAAPRLSLVLSMTLGFVPKLKKQYKRISNAQKAMGMYASNSINDRIMSRFRIISALIGWALENSVETADSMNARGYGLKGRSSYAIFVWTKRDLFVLFFNLFMFIVLITGMALMSQVSYYPVFKGVAYGVFDVIAYVGITVTAMFMALCEVQENIKWRLLISKV